MYRVLRWVEEGVGAKRKSGSGRPAVKLPPKQANTMIKEILCKVEVLHAKMNFKLVKEILSFIGEEATSKVGPEK